MTASDAPLSAQIHAVGTLRGHYHAYLASQRTLVSQAPDDGRDGRDEHTGLRQGSVAGKETRRGMRQGAEWANITQHGWRAFTQAWLETPEDVFVWSDLHLGHENIIKYTQRPFGGIYHMDESLLAHAQATVKDGQWLLFVGDLAMWKEHARVATWMAGCPGRKALVLGNHDLRGREKPARAEDWMALGFEAVADVAVLPAAHGVPELWATHYPMLRSDLPAQVLNLHGHTHTGTIAGPYVNACVEQVDYRPQNLVDLVRTNREAWARDRA